MEAESDASVTYSLRTCTFIFKLEAGDPWHGHCVRSHLQQRTFTEAVQWEEHVIHESRHVCLVALECSLIRGPVN